MSVKKFNELFENNISNIWNVKNYKTKYCYDYKKQLDDVLYDFKTWCNDVKIIPTTEMIDKVLEIASDDIIFYGQTFETKQLYDNGSDYEDYYEIILIEHFPQEYIKLKKIKDFNI